MKPRARKSEAAPVDYPPGYFLQPVLACKQLRFQSQIVIDPSTRRFISDYAAAARTRANSGFDRVPLGLPGATRYREQA